MPEQSSSPETFYVGLCMAGAVSAGAYTAGVMDYLIEALAEWEKRRGQPGVPQHKVQIPVMGGASAGGMTSIMAATALNNKLTPIDKPGVDLMAEHPENKLYHSWVDLTGIDMFSQMLDNSDILNGVVESALNSNFIDPIADRVVSVDNSPEAWLPLPAFVHPQLKIFTTLSNLQGFDYRIDFHSNSSQNDKYTLAIHNDYACFQLTEDDSSETGWIPLNLKTGGNKKTAGDAAMATGAFPVGLKSRLLDRPAATVAANPWLKDYIATNPLTGTVCNTLNIDGGMINNEPFEKVQDVLSALTGQPAALSQDFKQTRFTVLMIEPFPTSASKLISKSQDLLNVIGQTIRAILTQMRSKPLHFSNAYNDDCAGQYLITPSRVVQGPQGETDVAGELAIACGALEGFSGFINKEFRVHDYFLGRYNAKIFLRDYFTVPESALTDNPIFKKGYDGVDKSTFKSQSPGDSGYQIIPVFADVTDYTFPDFQFSSGSNWPILTDADIDKYQSALKNRIKVVLPNIFQFKWLKLLLPIAGFLGVYGALTTALIKTIKCDLANWQLLPKPPYCKGND